jgi:outer membrane lipoprotein
MRIRHYVMTIMVAALSACSTTPPYSEEMLRAVNRGMTPEQAVQENTKDVQVMWGGVIIKAANTPDHTDFTVLFYPLDATQRPDMNQKPRGRFLVRYPGYLETMVYAPGREVTVLGALQGIEEGKVGDAPYTFSVVKADKVYLWPLADDSRVHFGVGVGIGVHM